MKLRPAQSSDYTAIARLHAESWRHAYRGILSDQFLDHDVHRERTELWQQRLGSPAGNQRVIVATTDEQIMGFACIFLDDDPVYGTLLDNLHVSLQRQRTGMGKLLMQDCARIIQQEAVHQKLYLWVYESNTNARGMYERLGGQHAETVEKVNEDGTVARACRYVWEDVASLIKQ